MNIIYGLDTEKPVSEIQVRDAVINCFFEAHCLDTGFDVENPKADATKQYCASIVKKAFQETGGDFDKPTKDSLLKAINHLAEFSEKFRNPEIIQQHKGKILTLINLLD